MEFSELKTREDVAELLGVNDRNLRYLLYVRKTERCYTTYSIPKKRGGSRKISVPCPRLLNLQRKLLRVLEKEYRVKPSAYGFIKSKGHVENARNHLSRKLILNIDLKDFFQQIHFGRVRGLFIAKPYGIGEKAATVLAQIACYNGVLPQGAPTSPIISNMICSSLDTKLTKLAKKYHIVYTRYADDMTFSTHLSSFPEEIVYIEDGKVVIGNELKSIITSSSFIINEEKVYIRGTNRRQEVTGLTVNSRFVNLPRQYLRELRSILYDCETNTVYNSALSYISKGKTSNKRILKLAELIKANKEYEEKYGAQIIQWYSNVIKGKIEYIRCVRGGECKYYIKYALMYNRIFDHNAFRISNASYSIEEKRQKWCFVISEKGVNGFDQGSGFLLKDYGIFTNHHVIEHRESFFDIKTENGDLFKTIINEDDILQYDSNVDYALIKVNGHDGEGWDIADEDNLCIGKEVRLLGFPRYVKNSSITDTAARIQSTKPYYGNTLYIVDKNVIKGASGGIVIDTDGNAIGIIVTGANDYNSDGNEEFGEQPGFISLKYVLNDIEKKRNENE